VLYGIPGSDVTDTPTSFHGASAHAALKCFVLRCAPLQVLYGIPGSDVTNAPTFWGTVVLNLIFIFGLLVSPAAAALVTTAAEAAAAAAEEDQCHLAIAAQPHLCLQPAGEN
jgi:hypothetical protein